MTHVLGWLHLSDLHFLGKHAWRDTPALLTLVEDLYGMIGKGLRIDLILFTGDLGYGELKGDSLKTQYESAMEFFQELLRICNLPRERLLLVPGNHDIDFSKVLQSQTDYYRDKGHSVDFVNQHVTDCDPEFTTAMHRLAHFQTLVANDFPHITLSDIASFGYRTHVGNVCVSIAGLNSTWSCGRDTDNDKTKLWLAGEVQLHEYQKHVDTQNAGTGAHIRIALIHHPLSWLQDIECKRLRSRLQNDFDFLLHGHEHDQWVTEVPTPHHVVVAAGASTAVAPNEFGYNIVQVTRSATQIHLRTFDRDKGHGWIPQIIAGRADSGIWTAAAPRSIRTPAPPKSDSSARVTSIPSLRPSAEELWMEDVAQYRKRANQRIIDLMGGAPVTCYVDRTTVFHPSRNAGAVSATEEDPLGWQSAHFSRAEIESALQGHPTTVEILSRRPHAWLIGQAGMGKTLEAAHLAVRLTTDEHAPIPSCCVTLECRLLSPEAPSVEAAFEAASAICPKYSTFCNLTTWTRYLILDGFDEKRCKNEAFRTAVTTFQHANPNVRVLITSRDITSVDTTFSWEAYELEDITTDAALQYLVDRRGVEDQALRRTATQLETLSGYESICALLRIPFFLNAFAETLAPDTTLQSMGRVQILNSFVLELLLRQKRKGLTAPLTRDEKERLLGDLGSLALCEITGAPSFVALADHLAKLDLLIRPDDRRFRHSEVRDYLAAHFLFHHPTRENLALLSPLDDEQRFSLNSWLLELVNLSVPELFCRRSVLQYLWQDDPVLVCAGLNSDQQLVALPLPEAPWDPFATGFMRILRGEDARHISETTDIRDRRLSSPSEKLIHRLRHRDIQYLMRGVPQRRAIGRIEAAWSLAEDPWAELMPTMSSLANDWLLRRHGQQHQIHAFAYRTVDSRSNIDRAAEFANEAIENRIDTETLVRLYLLLMDLRAAFAPHPLRRQVLSEALPRLRDEVLGRALSAKQLQRIITHGIRYREHGGDVTGHRILSRQVFEHIYEGVPSEPPRLEALTLPSLIMELPRLACFANPNQAYLFTIAIWKELVARDDVTEVMPLTMIQGLRLRFSPLIELLATAWLQRWLEYWFGRLGSYECIELAKLGMRFSAVPQSLIDGGGWLQARDAIHLEHLRAHVFAKYEHLLPHYSLEQKRYWVRSASLYELVGLLKNRVIESHGAEDAFQQAVRRLEEESSPQHFWGLLRDGILQPADVPTTIAALSREVRSSPVAFELLSSVNLCVDPPSEEVISKVAHCQGCSLDTRLNLIRRNRKILDASWDAEQSYLEDVRLAIAANTEVIGLYHKPIPSDTGGLLNRFFTFRVEDVSANFQNLALHHPAFSHSIEFRDGASRNLFVTTAQRGQWHIGDIVSGVLWVTPSASDVKRTFTVCAQRRMAARIRSSDFDMPGDISPLVTSSQESWAV